MRGPDTLGLVAGIVAEVFERDPASLGSGTRLMRDLPCESIDLLEIGARCARIAGGEVDDDALFLKTLRVRLAGAAAGDRTAVCRREFPWLSEERISAVLGDVDRLEPFLTLGDMAAYLDWLAASGAARDGRR